MSSNAHNGYAQRAGHWVGHVCQKLVRGEKQLAAWLVETGMPAGVAEASIWTIRLIVLGTALYFFLIAAVLVAALVALASMLSHADVPPNHYQYEWRDGPLGHGMYNRDGIRIDPYDPNEEP